MLAQQLKASRNSNIRIERIGTFFKYNPGFVKTYHDHNPTKQIAMARSCLLTSPYDPGGHKGSSQFNCGSISTLITAQVSQPFPEDQIARTIPTHKSVSLNIVVAISIHRSFGIGKGFMYDFVRVIVVVSYC